MSEPQGSQYEVPENLFGPPEAPVGTQPAAVQAPKPQISLKHPVCTFFHVFWKVSAIVIYLFGGWFLKDDNLVTIFIEYYETVCITLLAFDFWTAKNVTGRLMVGLRWWNEVKEDGSSEWKFESKEDTTAISSVEKTIFWAALFLSPAMWLMFAVFSLLTLSPTWVVVDAVAILLNAANIVGYIKCAKDRSRFSSMAKNYFANAVISRATGGIV